MPRASPFPPTDTVIIPPETQSPSLAARLRLYLGYLTGAIYWRRRFSNFGMRSLIRRPRSIVNARYISIGGRVEIREGARLEVVRPSFADPIAIRIGNECSVHFNFHIGAALSVEIGNRVLVGANVLVTDHDHEPVGPGVHRSTAQRLCASRTRVGDDCWLGEGCKILKGVTLGRGCIVGANAVVTQSFADYSVIGGIPARELRTPGRRR